MLWPPWAYLLLGIPLGASLLVLVLCVTAVLTRAESSRLPTAVVAKGRLDFAPTAVASHGGQLRAYEQYVTQPPGDEFYVQRAAYWVGLRGGARVTREQTHRPLSKTTTFV